jgi:hypothetical protein
MVTVVELERRLTAVEQEIAQLRMQLSAREPHTDNWLEAVAGTFANDPLFDQAMRLGRRWRRTENRKSLQSAAKRTR